MYRRSSYEIRDDVLIIGSVWILDFHHIGTFPGRVAVHVHTCYRPETMRAYKLKCLEDIIRWHIRPIRSLTSPKDTTGAHIPLPPARSSSQTEKIHVNIYRLLF